MNSIGVDPVSGFAVALQRRQVDKVLRLGGDFLTEGGAVVGRQAVAEHLDLRSIMMARDALCANLVKKLYDVSKS